MEKKILDTGYWILDAGCWMLDVLDEETRLGEREKGSMEEREKGSMGEYYNCLNGPLSPNNRIINNEDNTNPERVKFE